MTVPDITADEAELQVLPDAEAVAVQSSSTDISEEKTRARDIALRISTISSRNPSLSLRSSRVDENSQDTPLQRSNNASAQALEAQPSHESSPQLENIRYASLKLFQPWFPQVDPEDPRARTWRTRKARREVVLWTCLATSSTICIANFVLAVFAWLRYPSTDDGVVTLYRGDCTVVKRANSAAHVMINIFGTLLFGASNLTLQLLAAPTRKEVDEAHALGTWLDIGVPSYRNLRRISPNRRYLWWLLAVSSIPIHFLYNSSVFASLSTNEVEWVIAREAYLTGQTWHPRNSTWNDTVGYAKSEISSLQFDALWTLHNDYVINSTLYENHSTYDCLKAYVNPFDWRPLFLIMISSDTESAPFYISPQNNSFFLNSGVARTGPTTVLDFLCETDSETTEMCGALNTLTPDTTGPFVFKGNTIDYCLYKATDSVKSTIKTCRLQGSPQVLLMVALFNMVKCLCVFWIILFVRGPTLCILGDAVASFLETPDKWTVNLGIASKDAIMQTETKWHKRQGGTKQWDPVSIPWRHAASTRRWVFTFVASAVLIIAGWVTLADGLYTQGVYHRSISVKSLWAMGFGETNADELVSYDQAVMGKMGLFVNILISNVWQVMISLLYIGHNALLSCMMVANEWFGFATHRKTLRVSAPRGIQRSSYTLSMPLRYGIPMMLIFSMEHWILSQATFIVRVNRTDYQGNSSYGWTTSGYSIIPCIIALVAFSLILIIQVLHGYLRKFSNQAGMPLASTCSAAISAACHQPHADNEAHLLPVQWGIIDQDESGRDRCSFTTFRNVARPTPGMDYLGLVPNVPENKKRWLSCLKTLPKMRNFVASKEPSYIGRLMARKGRHRKPPGGSLKDS